MKKLFILISIILFSINIYSAGPPNPNCLPFSECWCETRPNHPACKEEPPCFPPQACVSINSGIEYLALAGGLLLIYYYKSKK